MLKYLILTALACCVFIGCSTGSGHVDSISGGYSALPPYYWTAGGVLYATDGQQTYALRRPEVSSGSAGGASIAQSEEWIKVGGSEVAPYQRSAATFRNQSLKPEFHQ